MEYPPADQVVTDVVQSLGPKASDAAIDEHIASLNAAL